MRSYVTIATTIKAITEMPAKMPSPIGRTCRDLPGIANGVADALEDEFSAAAMGDTAAVLDDDDTSEEETAGCVVDGEREIDGTDKVGEAEFCLTQLTYYFNNYETDLH